MVKGHCSGVISLGIFLLFFCIVVPARDAVASETDGYTRRCESLKDTTQYLDHFVNQGLDKAVFRANRTAGRRYLRTNYPFRPRKGKDYCNSEDLYRQIRRLFARKLIGQMEAHINALPEEMARRINLPQSIYRDFPINKAPTLVGIRKMGAVVRIGDHMVGADKFGHFFSEGWTYYKIAYGDVGPDFFGAIEYGTVSESLYYGILTTGVYSHADLVANFNGMRFYNAILGQGEDPLGAEHMPEIYVKCLNKKWERVKDFDWTDFVDSGWDEGVNHNFYRDGELLELVLERVEETLKSLPEDCPCEDADDEQTSLVRKYGDFAGHLLNVNNPSVLPEALQPDHIVRSKIQNTLSRMHLSIEGQP